MPDALTTGDAGSDVPLMLGFTAHEFNAVPRPGATAETLHALLAALRPRRSAPPRLRRDVRRRGPWRPAEPGHHRRRLPRRRPRHRRSRHGRPTWLYEFRFHSTAPGFTGLAYHCTDLPFAFDLLDAEGVTAALGDRPSQHLADAVHTAWTAFVHALDPGADWPAYTTARRETRVWDTTPHTDPDPLHRVRAGAPQGTGRRTDPGSRPRKPGAGRSAHGLSGAGQVLSSHTGPHRE
ncbi:hypothetical protein ACFU98_46510 [Streptomyces sp. NPDC057575]|uniref:hypothetical protein n=1 Tax=unclassified Streptomyces TaxID=2593676 RepID=UPI003689CF77